MNKIIKIIFITLIINGLLLPLYVLTAIDLQSFVAVMIRGIHEMFVTTVFIVAVYFLMNHFSRNWFQKRSWRIALSVFALFCVTLLFQMVWSMALHNDSLNHFTGFWGFYFFWTLLTCLLTPLLDAFFSKRKQNSTTNN